MARLVHLFTALLLPFSGRAATHDLVLCGGRIVDGTASPWCTADFAPKGDTITRRTATAEAELHAAAKFAFTIARHTRNPDFAALSPAWERRASAPPRRSLAQGAAPAGP